MIIDLDYVARMPGSLGLSILLDWDLDDDEEFDQTQPIVSTVTLDGGVRNELAALQAGRRAQAVGLESGRRSPSITLEPGSRE
jgi:hypothetical protein